MATGVGQSRGPPGRSRRSLRGLRRRRERSPIRVRIRPGCGLRHRVWSARTRARRGCHRSLGPNW